MPSGTTLDHTSTDQPTFCYKLRWTAFNTRCQTHQCLSTDASMVLPDVMPKISETPDPTPKSLTADRLEALLQMHKMDPFCKRISKCKSNGKAPHHEMDLFSMSEAYYINTSLIQARNSLP